MLEDHLNSLGCPIVFSHNDLLLGNVIWDKVAKKASFIDYEYGASNYQPYDIANHFNEFVGKWGSRFVVCLICGDWCLVHGI